LESIAEESNRFICTLTLSSKFLHLKRLTNDRRKLEQTGTNETKKQDRLPNSLSGGGRGGESTGHAAGHGAVHGTVATSIASASTDSVSSGVATIGIKVGSYISS
jgi:hypothetical protein